MTQTAQQPSTDQADTRYLLIVGGLLMVIIATMCLLWMRERGKRIEAENKLANINSRDAKLQSVLSQLVGEPGEGMRPGPAGVTMRPIERGDLRPAAGTLNGEAAQVFEVSASAGERIGFRPGDVVRVAATPPASQPATAPTPGK